MNRWDGKKAQWDKLVNHRCIIVEDTGYDSSTEALVLEVSPSGKYVKFQYPDGSKRWEDANEHLLIEDLGVK